MKFDDGLMYCAISNVAETVGGPKDTGFLNVKSGEIIFVYDNEGEATDWTGVDFKEAIAARRRREASREEWLEIPKYDKRTSSARDADSFIAEFLEQHGLSAG